MDDSSSDVTAGLKVAIVILVLATLGIIILPFLSGQIFRGHDILDHMIYFRGFHQAISEGQFPVRFINSAYPGFNYPAFNFYPTMFYYLTLIPSSLGFSNTLSFNLTLFVLWLFSGIFMYLFTRVYFGKLGGLVAACFYLLAPYHLVQLFVRMAVSEFTVMAFLPALFWAIQSFWEQGRGRYFSLTGLIFAGFLLSHNITLIIFAPLLFGYIIYLYWQKPSRKHLFWLLFSLSLGLGMAAFFLLPAYSEIGYSRLLVVTTGQSDFHNHFICFNQLFEIFWGFGGSLPGCYDQMSLQLGVVHWLTLGIVGGIGLVGLKKGQLKRELLLVFLFFLATIFALFMTLPLSVFVWEKAPLLSYLQFPWRYLTLSVFASSFIAGSAIFLIRSGRYLLCAILLFLNLYFYSGYAKPLVFLSEGQIHFNNQLFLQGREEEFKEVFGRPRELDSSWVKVMPEVKKVPVGEAEVIFGKATVNKYNLKTTEKGYQISVGQESVVRFYTHYFPGWQVSVNGWDTGFSFDNQYGYIDLNLPAGNHSVLLYFGDTQLRRMANNISLFSLLVISVFGICFAFFKRKKLC